MMLCIKSSRLVATCVHLGFCFLVTVMLSVGVASVSGYTNGHKNPEEISEAVQFTLNIKPKILLQWAPHASHKIKLAVRGGIYIIFFFVQKEVYISSFDSLFS